VFTGTIDLHLADVAGVLGGLLNDAEDLLMDAAALVKRGEREGILLDLETKHCYAADARFHQAINTLASTTLAILQDEGLKTSFSAGKLSWLLSCRGCSVVVVATS
jgi:hypothetical protein